MPSPGSGYPVNQFCRGSKFQAENHLPLPLTTSCSIDPAPKISAPQTRPGPYYWGPLFPLCSLITM